MPIIPTLATTQKKESIIPTIEPEVDTNLTPKQKADLLAQTKIGAAAREEDQGNYSEDLIQDADALRRDVANADFDARRKKQIQEIQDSLATEQVEGIAGALLTLQQQQPKTDALERNAVEVMADVKDPVKRELLKNRTNAVEKVINDNAHLLYVSNLIGKYETLEKDDNIFEELGGFLSAVFFVDAAERQLVDLGDAGSKIRLMLNQIKNAPAEHKGALTKRLEDFLADSQILGNNPQSIADMLTISQASVDEDIVSNVMDFLDFTGVPGAAKLASKVSKTFKVPVTRSSSQQELLNTAKEVGNTDDIVKEVLNTDINANFILRSAEEQVEAALRYTDDDVAEVFGRYTDEEIAKQKKFDEVLTGLVDDTVDIELTSERIKRWATEDHGIARDHIDKVKYDVEKQSYTIDLVDPHGRPFETEAMATRYAEESLNLADYKIIQDQVGNYKIKASWTDERLGFGKEKKVYPGVWFFDNIGNMVDSELLADFRLIEGRGERMVEGISEMLRDINKGFSKTDKAAWNRAVEHGVETKQWLTPVEFKDKFGPTANKKHWQAYESFKKLNEMDYWLHQAAKRRQKENQNLSTFTVKMDDGVRQQIEAVEVGIPDIGDNKVLVHGDEAGGKLSSYILDPKGAKEDLEQLTNTHRLVKLDNDAAELMSNSLELTPTRYALIKKDIQPEPLRHVFTEYAAGGRRVVDSPYYIKSANIVKLDDGSFVRKRDTTLFAASSKRQADQFIKELNESIDDLVKVEVRELHTDIATNNLSSRSTLVKAGITSLEELKLLAARKRLLQDNLDDMPVIQAVADRAKVNLGDVAFSTDLTEDIVSSRLGGSKDSYRSAETIPHIEGIATQTLDPLSAIAKNLENTVRMPGYSAFRDRALEFFQAKYKKYIPTKYRGDLDAILRLDELPDATAQINRQFHVNKKWIQDMVSHTSPTERAFQAALEAGIDWALEGKVGDVLSKTSTKLSKTLHERFGVGLGKEVDVRASASKRLSRAKIDSEIKGVIFNFKLGFFNFASYPIQAIHAAHVAGLSGKVGWEGAAKAMALQRALYLSDDALGEVAKRYGKLGFESEADFIEAVKEFKGHGFRHVGKNIAYVDGVSGVQLGSNRLDSITRHHAMAFNAGERYSRLTAYMTARLKWLRNEGNAGNTKGLSATSPEGRRYINTETHRLMQGMTRADVQFAHRGALSIPLQFSSYPMRAFSAFFGKEFTNAEKLRLAGTYMALYGASGIPILTNISDYVKSKYGDKYDNQTIEKFASNGIIDTFFLASLDADTNFAGRAGLGSWFKEFTRQVSEANFLELMAGPAGQTGFSFSDSFSDALAYHKLMGENAAVSFTKAGLVSLRNSISSASNLVKLMHAVETNKLISTKTGMAYDEMSVSEAALMFVGIPPQSYSNMTRLFYDNKVRKDAVKENANIMINIYRDRVEAYKNGDDEAVNRLDSAMSQLNHNLRAFGLSQEVYTQFNRDRKTKDLMDSMSNAALRKNMPGWVDDYKVASDVVEKEQRKEERD